MNITIEDPSWTLPARVYAVCSDSNFGGLTIAGLEYANHLQVSVTSDFWIASSNSPITLFNGEAEGSEVIASWSDSAPRRVQGLPGLTIRVNFGTAGYATIWGAVDIEAVGLFVPKPLAVNITADSTVVGALNPDGSSPTPVGTYTRSAPMALPNQFYGFGGRDNRSSHIPFISNIAPSGYVGTSDTLVAVQDQIVSAAPWVPVSDLDSPAPWGQVLQPASGTYPMFADIRSDRLGVINVVNYSGLYQNYTTPTQTPSGNPPSATFTRTVTRVFNSMNDLFPGLDDVRTVPNSESTNALLYVKGSCLANVVGTISPVATVVETITLSSALFSVTKSATVTNAPVGTPTSATATCSASAIVSFLQYAANPVLFPVTVTHSVTYTVSNGNAAGLSVGGYYSNLTTSITGNYFTSCTETGEWAPVKVRAQTAKVETAYLSNTVGYSINGYAYTAAPFL